MPIATQALRRAHVLLGGTSALARALVVPESVVKRWVQGEDNPPSWAFLRAVDIINHAEERSRTARRREHASEL